MASYKSIKDQIVAVLGTVSGIEAVYGKEAKVLNEGGYPAATVEAKGHSSNYYTVGPNGMNERVYEHFIRIYFRTDETDRKSTRLNSSHSTLSRMPSSA